MADAPMPAAASPAAIGQIGRGFLRSPPLRPAKPPAMPPPTSPSPARIALRRRMAVLAWRALALLALGLGLLGVVLPVMPTVPFLIAAAWAASKGWPAFEAWLLQHPSFGPPVRQWRERGAVPRRAKWISSLMMACSAIGLQLFATVPLWTRLAVPAIMLAVALWMWQRPDA